MWSRHKNKQIKNIYQYGGMLYLLYTRWMAKISRRRLSTRRLWFSNIVTFNLAVLNMSHTVFQSIDWLIMLKNKISMSQSLWQKIEKPDLNVVFNVVFFFFFFFWAADISNLSRSQLCFVQYEIWNLIFGWTSYKTEHKVKEVCCSKCFIVSVMSFHLYFDKQVHKKTEKRNKQAKKN